jgi:plasmid maintenance system antidote protein VapI
MPHRNNPSAVGDALKADLHRLGISQAELARRMDEGLTQQAISKWIAHNKVPEDRLPKLSQVLGADAQVLKLASQQDSLTVRELGALYNTRGNIPMKSREEPDRPDLRAHTEGARLRELLPEHLRANLDATLPLGPDRTVDYLSDALALELKAVAVPRGIISQASRAAVQLGVVKALVPQSDRRRYTVALIVHESLMSPEYLDAVNRLTADLAVQQIQLLVVRNVETVVQYIVATEDSFAGGRPRDLFDE